MRHCRVVNICKHFYFTCSEVAASAADLYHIECFRCCAMCASSSSVFGRECRVRAASTVYRATMCAVMHNRSPDIAVYCILWIISHDHVRIFSHSPTSPDSI